MEASTTIAKGEVRRLHIIYFLSHMGHIEHPHLIRVLHLNRTGVYLRDVKRWMAELRGKDMPEAFAWSYKRRYKNGYVWQDLMDDDLITPICDNEYVIKGSEIFPTSTSFAANADIENKYFAEENTTKLAEFEADGFVYEQEKISILTSPNNSIDTPTKSSSQSHEEESPISSSESSTLTEDSMKQGQNSRKSNGFEEKSDKYESLSSSSVYSNHLGISGSSFSISSQSPSQQSSQFAKSKSYSNGASKMLRNLITCGAVDTNDTALIAVNKSSTNKSVKKVDGVSQICKTPWNQQEQQHNSRRTSFEGLRREQQESGFCKPKAVPVAYKPVGAPTCSQCRKSFKPEKLHTHMKSCKGLKTSAKNNAAASVKRSSSPLSTKSSNQIMAISLTTNH